MEDFEEDLEENLEGLRKSLKSQSFDPDPVRRVYIPKGDGRKRPLGIPNIEDRIVQETLRMVLEPIYESDFSGQSFGFRPNRCTMDAIKSVFGGMAPSMHSYKQWIIDADIKGFFDNVDHRTLEQIIQNRITDQKIRDLIWKFLKAGVMEDGTLNRTMLGTPQGGIVSPLLANIYLNELDQWAKKWTDFSSAEYQRRRRRGKPSWSYVRYADDFLFQTDGSKENAEEMMQRIEDFVTEELSLELSDEKTRLVNAKDGIEFLGYHLEAKEKTTGGVKREVPKEAKKDIKGKVREAANGDTKVSARAKLKALNAVLRGWENYYKYATNATKVFGEVNHFTWDRVTHWLARKFKCSRRKLVSRKLDSTNPIRINGVRLHRLDGSFEWYEQEGLDEHPYLTEGTRKREELPEKDPWLGHKEDRPGWKDKRREALERDEWTCQKCGRDLEESSPHVHHRKPYSKYNNPHEAHKLNNLTSLCAECHRQIESNNAE
jgi:group II intron reverse transcriptase/maturase